MKKLLPVDYTDYYETPQSWRSGGCGGGPVVAGDKRRTLRQQTKELDSLGATLTTGSTVEATRTGGVCLAGNAPKLLAIVADVARNAAFPDAELALYKQNTQQNPRLESLRW